MPRKRIGWEPRRQRKLRVLKTLPVAVKQEVRPALAKAAKRINDFQRRMVPVDSGEVRGSIGYGFGDSPVGRKHAKTSLTGRGVRGTDDSLMVLIYAGGEGPDDKGWYARFVEYGTAPRANHPGTKPYPFFWPAVRLSRKDVNRNVARAFNKAVKKAGLMTNAARGRHARKT